MVTDQSSGPKSPVFFANRVMVVRNTDHFVLKFAFRQKETDDESEDQPGDELARVVIPLTTSVDLTLAVFEGLFRSAMGLQTFFSSFGARVTQLNVLKASIEEAAKKQAAAQEQAK